MISSGPTASPSALPRASATSPRNSSNSLIRPGGCGGGQARGSSRNGFHLIHDHARRTRVDDPRAQQHPLPLGHAHPSARVHGKRGLQCWRQPVRHLYTSGKEVRGPDARAQAVARYQGQRLARYAAVVAAAREADAFRVRRPGPEQFTPPRSGVTPGLTEEGHDHPRPPWRSSLARSVLARPQPSSSCGMSSTSRSSPARTTRRVRR